MSHKHDLLEFRLPLQETNRLYRNTALTFVTAFVLINFVFVPKATLDKVTILVNLALVVIGYLLYLQTKCNVWLTVSENGIFGKGETGRKIQIGWQDTIIIKKANNDSLVGFEIYTSENIGYFKQQVNTLFIPKAIILTEEFKSAINQFAPDNHPLHDISNYF